MGIRDRGYWLGKRVFDFEESQGPIPANSGGEEQSERLTPKMLISILILCGCCLLYTSFTLNGMYLRNRIVMGPIGTGFAGEDHLPTGRMADYYGARAQGGAGLVICEHTISQPVGYWGKRAGELFSERSVEGFCKVTGAIPVSYTHLLPSCATTTGTAAGSSWGWKPMRGTTSSRPG